MVGADMAVSETALRTYIHLMPCLPAGGPIVWSNLPTIQVVWFWCKEVSLQSHCLQAPLIPYLPTYICTLVRTSSKLKYECTPTSVGVSLTLLLVADHITQAATREIFMMVLSKL